MVNTITYGLPASYYTTQYRTPDGGSANSSGTGRTIRDTVEISEDGQKIINLARGAELAAALPDAGADREAFDAALERAQEDIKRITTLFGGVLNPLSVNPAQNSGDGQSVNDLDPEIAAALKRAFEDIRQVSNEVDQTLQQRQSQI